MVKDGLWMERNNTAEKSEGDDKVEVVLFFPGCFCFPIIREPHFYLKIGFR